VKTQKSHFSSSKLSSILSCNWASSRSQKLDLFFADENIYCGSPVNSANFLVYAPLTMKQHIMRNIHASRISSLLRYGLNASAQ